MTETDFLAVSYDGTNLFQALFLLSSFDKNDSAFDLGVVKSFV